MKNHSLLMVMSVMSAALAANVAKADTKVWKNPSAGGTWSSSSYWSNGVPNADDDVSIPISESASPTYTINVDKDVRINSLRIHEGKGGVQTFSGDNKMSLGAGGLIMESNKSQTWGYYGQGTIAGLSPTFEVPIHLMASQSWYLGGIRGWCYENDGGYRSFTKDISTELNVEWRLYGYAHYKFVSGSSSGFKGMTVSGALLHFVGTNQFNRLGKKITLYQDGMENDSTASTLGTIGNAPALIYEFATGEQDGAVANHIAINAPDYACQFTSGSQQSWVSSISGDSGRRGWSYRHIPIAIKQQEGEESNPVRLYLNGGLSGSIPNSDISLTFAQSRKVANVCNPFRPTNTNPFDQRIVITEDGASLNGAVTALTMIEIGNKHALGVNNRSTVKLGSDGWWSTVASGYDVHGVFLRPGITYSGTLAPQSRSDGNGAKRRPGVMMFGASETPATTGETLATFESAISAGSTTYDILRFGSAAKGVCARFTGKITSVFNEKITKSGSAVGTSINGGHVDIVGWGDIEFDNADNSFDTNICVRSGGLALGNSTAGGSKPIFVGGRIPWMNETRKVRCVMANTPTTSWTLTDATISGTVYYGKTLSWNPSKPGAEELDGVNPKPDDYVLIAIPYQTKLNGVWKVGEQSVWTRVDELDSADDLVGKYGLRVKVTEGKRFANKAFMLVTNPTYYRCSSQFNVSDERFNADYGAPMFHLEGDAEPDVAFKTAGNADINCTVVITDNDSTGESALGSLTEGSASTFSGTATVEKDLTLVAARGSLFSVTGRITGDGDLIGGGYGTNDISCAGIALGDDCNFRMKSGILKAGSTQLQIRQGVYRKLSWTRSADSASATKDTTGVLLVDGNADLRNHELNLNGLAVSLTQGDSGATRLWPIVKATGTIVAPENVTLPAGWTLVLRNSTREGVDSVLYAEYINPGLFMEIL